MDKKGLLSSPHPYMQCKILIKQLFQERDFKATDKTRQQGSI